jgi:AcrR family transcriptional regulator
MKSMKFGQELIINLSNNILTIDRLCQIAERTKGSFYHHFKSHDDFVTDLLVYWQFKYTERIISTVEQLADLNARRRELDRLAASVDSRVERAIRQWAGVDERVQHILKHVDDRRIQYLAKLISELGQPDDETAYELAVIEYAAFVGLQQLFPQAESQWIERFSNRVTQLTSSFNT